MTARRPIALDLRVGGHGDNWMRLVGLYTTARLRPDLSLTCIVPSMLRGLAERTFGDRLTIGDGPRERALTYETRGLRHLVPQALRGQRFVVPYHRVVLRDWGDPSVKDRLNQAAFSAFNAVNLVQLPPWHALDVYQGYLEVVSVARLRSLTWEQFVAASRDDYDVIADRLNGAVATSPELVLPDDLHESVVVFPSGNGHQFMPVSWARTHLPDAYYCFFARDAEQSAFREAGLKVVNFYREPGDIVELGRTAHRAVCTDSFASHLLQHSVLDAVLALAEFPRERVVSPHFPGTVVDSAAPCSPCPHLERGGFPTCKAGFVQCLTWSDQGYTRRILDAVG